MDSSRQTPLTIRLGLCLCTSLMVALAFPKPGWSILAPFALAPLLRGITNTRPVRAALLGWFTGIAAYAIGWAWILEVAQVLQHISLWKALPALAIAHIYHGGQFALFSAAVCWLRGRGDRAPVLATASCWSLLEWGYPKLMPWSLANVTIDWPYVPQIADTIGVYGVGFLLAATSAVAFNLAFTGQRSGTARWTPAVLLLGCYGFAVIYGTFRVGEFRADDSTKGIEVGVVQAALPTGDVGPRVASQRSWDAYSKLSEGAELRGVDVLFWPETTIRDYLRHGSKFTNLIASLTKKLDTTLVLGALDLSATDKGELSATYAFDSAGRNQRAHKMILVPFGEYTPGSDWIPQLSSWRTTGSFIPGTDHPVLEAAGLRMATSVCFEAIRPGFNADQVRQGADILVNVSDDSWFGETSAPYQHLLAVRWRALESRRWLVRASNSGVSAIVDPAGRVVAHVPLGRAGVLRSEVFPETTTTLYVRWGDWFLFVALAPLAMGYTHRRRNL